MYKLRHVDPDGTKITRRPRSTAKNTPLGLRGKNYGGSNTYTYGTEDQLFGVRGNCPGRVELAGMEDAEMQNMSGWGPGAEPGGSGSRHRGAFHRLLPPPLRAHAAAGQHGQDGCTQTQHGTSGKRYETCRRLR
ncbi:uncharacterized protein LOC143508312 [Brachyhypopomus gauderio]|uniref:uncharacterized protein LOC143508312 n=1 Tax=Brachyhypopomus gauderio TaxID=698409 RepID=UPI004042CB6A